MRLTWEQRYERIQTLMRWENGFVHNGALHPRWIDNARLWWIRSGELGREVRVWDVETGLVASVAFSDICSALSKEMCAEVDPERSVLNALDVTLEPLTTSFSFGERSWSFDAASSMLTERFEASLADVDVSPDGRWGIFSRDFDLWVRELATGEERQLTDDGSHDEAYGASCIARRNPVLITRPEGRWSPDSRHYFTMRTDERHVGTLSLINYTPPPGMRPMVVGNRTALPGDERPAEMRLMVIDTVTAARTDADYEPLPFVRMNDAIFGADMAWWSLDGTTAWFVHLERGEKAAHVVAMDIATGTCRRVMTETSDVPLELSVNVYAPALLHPLMGTNELVWFSERSGRGHLYLIDLVSGEWKHPVTQGEWQVREVLRVDEESRTVLFMAGGLDSSDPYLRQPCRASLDGGDIVVLSDAPGDHQVWRPREFALMGQQIWEGMDIDRVSGFNTDGSYFVETVGTVEGLPSSTLRRGDGTTVAVLERAEATGLPDWFMWPEPFCVKAADGVTDIYGILFRPESIEPGTLYPLIDYIYGGPQVSHTPKSAFVNSIDTGNLFTAACFSQLGGFAVILDGRGSAMRERSFRQASLGAIHTASNLADHEAAIRQLAERYPIDLERVGITGFSGGGYATALAAFTRGDFFKVTVAGAGNYDQALFWHGWGERYHGPYDPELYAQQAAATYASGLQGRLMLIHGLLDGGCHPAGLFNVIQALNDANKDFDLVLLPQIAHGSNGYAERRRLDHFVTYLFGGEPPVGATIEGPHELLMKKMSQLQFEAS